MKTRTLCCCLVAVAAMLNGANAQPVLKCGGELVMQQMMTSLGRNLTCTARFDVIRSTPANITITASDTLPGYMFLDEQTIENLHQFAFDRDTFGLTLVFQYIIDSTVSVRYSRFVGRDTVEIVTPKLPPIMRTCVTEARAIDFENNTLTLYGTLFTYEEMAGASDMLVERTFKDEMSETKVLKNNRPALEQDLQQAARYFNRSRFRGAVSTIPDEKFQAMRYLVRFKVVRLYRGQPHRYDAL